MPGRHRPFPLTALQAYPSILVDTPWRSVGQRLDIAFFLAFFSSVKLCSKVEPVIRSSPCPSRAVVNAGLWLDDPDVDAITRLCNDIVATECDNHPAFFSSCFSDLIAFVAHVFPGTPATLLT